MKKILIVTFSIISIQLNAQNAPQTYLDSVSYCIGLDIANNIIQANLANEFTPEMVALGIVDKLKVNNLKISEEQSKLIMQAYMMQLQQKAQTKDNKEATQNMIAGKDFLEKNKLKDSIQVTESGLQYKIITAGSGYKPTINDTVEVHYEGKLINGKIFDSSIKRGQPAEFAVNRVIPGFTEALMLMSPGAHYIIYIPSELAYGANAPGSIGPNQTLIFDLQLISVPSAPTPEEIKAMEKAEKQKAKESKKKDKK